MNTKELLDHLSSLNTKKEVENFIATELNNAIMDFNTNGYKVDITNGFIGQQILKAVDLLKYQYFRDLHFLYYGLKGNWIIKEESIYFNTLKSSVESIYNKAQ